VEDVGDEDESGGRPLLRPLSAGEGRGAAGQAVYYKTAYSMPVQLFDIIVTIVPFAGNGKKYSNGRIQQRPAVSQDILNLSIARPYQLPACDLRYFGNGILHNQ